MNLSSLLYQQLDLIVRPSQRLYLNFYNFTEKHCNSANVAEAIDHYIQQHRKQVDRVLPYALLIDYLLSYSQQQYQTYWTETRLQSLITLLEHYHKTNEIVATLKRKWIKIDDSKREMLSTLERNDFVAWCHSTIPPTCYICSKSFQIRYNRQNETWLLKDAFSFDNDKIVCHQNCV